MKVLGDIPAMLYRWYIQLLSFGSTRLNPHPAAAHLTAKDLDELQLESFEKLDKDATWWGEVYRGMGVLTGLLGIMLMAIAIAPPKAEIPAWLGQRIADIKLAIMLR